MCPADLANPTVVRETPPLAYMNPRLHFVCCDWLVTGGEKAPDKWAWPASTNESPTLVFRRQIVSFKGSRPLIYVSKDHPGNFIVFAHNVQK